MYSKSAGRSADRRILIDPDRYSSLPARRSSRPKAQHASRLHGHARFRGADARRAGGARLRHCGGLYARAEAGRPRHGALALPGRARGARLRAAGAHAEDAAHRRRRGRVSRPWRRRRRGRGLWPHPAETDPRRRAARLLQPARLGAPALARRGADQPRRHGRRRRDRRHGDEDGGRARTPARSPWPSGSRSVPT